MTSTEEGVGGRGEEVFDPACRDLLTWLEHLDADDALPLRWMLDWLAALFVPLLHWLLLCTLSTSLFMLS